jgi:hypothetical protein
MIFSNKKRKKKVASDDHLPFLSDDTLLAELAGLPTNGKSRKNKQNVLK